MTGKQRVYNALNKKAAGLPIYFGGTSSALSDVAYFKLKKHLGLEGEVDPYRKGHTGNIYDPAILGALHSDVRFVVYNLHNYGVRETLGADRIIDEWGVPILMSGEHGSRVDPPLADVELEQMKSHQFPSPAPNERNANLRKTALELKRQGEYAVVARAVHSASFLEYGCWLRGYENFFCDLATDSPEGDYVLDRILQAQMEFYEDFLNQVGDCVDIVETSEDYGTQASMFLSRELFCKKIKPRRRALNDLIRKKAPQAKILHHSCGAIRPIIGDLIETGVDILNPVQPNLPGMDGLELKREFGETLCFCGGFDMIRALNGSLADVEREVERCARDYSEGGGYLFATSNHIQSDTPVENIIRLFEYASKFEE